MFEITYKLLFNDKMPTLFWPEERWNAECKIPNDIIDLPGAQDLFYIIIYTLESSNTEQEVRIFFKQIFSGEYPIISKNLIKKIISFADKVAIDHVIYEFKKSLGDYEEKYKLIESIVEIIVVINSFESMEYEADRQLVSLDDFDYKNRCLRIITDPESHRRQIMNTLDKYDEKYVVRIFAECLEYNYGITCNENLSDVLNELLKYGNSEQIQYIFDYFNAKPVAPSVPNLIT